jgi:hypothetical protein
VLPSAETSIPSTVAKLPVPLEMLGLKVVETLPLVELKAARCRRAAPSAESKSPPMYTVAPLLEVVTALTLSFTYGLQPKAAPLVGWRAATRARAAPATTVKSPPADTRVPAGETLRALTTLLASGFQASRVPVAASQAASRLRATPSTWVKLPPR